MAPMAHLRDNLRVCGVGVLLVGLLALSGAQSRSLLAMRTRMARERGAAEAESMPPALAFANVALGGFRGMIADLLWLRAQSLQEAGRYVELVPLAESIAALEPDNGEIWAYHAWNLSFNVCAMMSRPEDRWRWVLAGIDLLERRGMRLHPTDSRSRRELAWIFQFKLGTNIDYAAGHYRAEWARIMEDYLEPDGRPPVIPSLSASELDEVLLLDAARMVELDRRFGPLDWRVPGSHAVYWAMEALDRAPDRERLACRRIAYQSLVQMIQHTGRVAGDPRDPDYNGVLRPNTALLPGTLDFLRETVREHPSHGVRAALIGLLLDATAIAAREGRPEESREHYAEIIARFAPNSPLPSYKDVLAGKVDFSAMPWDRTREPTP